MSELRIALVAEGPTDGLIIEAGLRAFLTNRPFVLNQLQPEATQPQIGTGWGGVLKWRQAFRQSGCVALEDDPKLAGFDMLILHLDADVAHKSYADYGPQVAQMAADAALQAMPFSQPCPPPSATVVLVQALLRSWLGIAAIGSKTAFCIPSKSTEAWLAAALLSNKANLMADIECEMNSERILANLPKAQRVRKSRREYLAHVDTITETWADRIKLCCSQAIDFEARATSVLQ